MGAFEKDGGHLDGEDSIIDSVKDTTMCTPGVSTWWIIGFENQSIEFAYLRFCCFQYWNDINNQPLLYFMKNVAV